MLSRARGKQGSSGAPWMLLILLATGTQAALSAATDAKAYELEPHLSDQATPGLYTELSSPSANRDDFHRGIVIAEAELDQMRAGFTIGGVDMDFGARLRTMIDNSVELVSVVNFTRAGASIVSQTFRDSSTLANQVGRGTGMNITDVSPGGVNLSGLSDFSGVALNDHKGFTAALHNITRNAIVSGVVSNASGRNIQQRIDIDIRLNNVGALRAAKQRASILDSFSGILR